MRFLGIKILACNAGEYRLFRERISSDFHPFSLISEDLLPLQGVLTAFGPIEITTPNFGLGLQFQSNPPAKSAFLERSIDLDFSATVPFSQAFYQTRLPQPTSSTCAILQDVSSFFQLQGSRDHSTEPSLAASTNLKHSDNQSSLLLQGNTDDKEKTKLVTVQSVVGKRTIENELSDNNSNRKDKKRRASFTLLESEMSPCLLSHLAEVRQFYLANINCNNDGGPLQSSTLHKMFERISSFLWFLKNMRCLEPALSHCTNPQLVQEFVNYMIDKQGLKSITCSWFI